MTTYKTSQFDYNPKSKIFTTEASRLRLPVGHWPTEFDLVSEKTDKSVHFGIVGDETQYGELRFVRYSGFITREDGTQNWFSLNIYND